MIRKSSVIMLLKNYRTYKAQYNQKNKEREGLIEALKGLEEYPEEKENIIHSMQLSAVDYGFRSAPTNKFYSVVENTALAYQYEKNPSMQEIKEKINCLNVIIRRLATEIYTVEDVILVSLSDEQKFLLESVYIRGQSWEQTRKEYADRYKLNIDDVLIDTLKAKKKIAKTKIENLLKN